METILEIALIAMLAATLFHALRLERALGVLKSDRAALEDLVTGFNTSTRQAEQGIERLRATADGAGRQIARQIDVAQALRDDLVFLAERGERLADRLDSAVRTARSVAPDENAYRPEVPAHRAPMLELVKETMRGEAPAFGRPDREAQADVPAEEPAARLRSQAERDLLKALRMAR